MTQPMMPGAEAFIQWDTTAPPSTSYHRGIIVAYLYDSQGSSAGAQILLFENEVNTLVSIPVDEATVIDEPTYLANS